MLTSAKSRASQVILASCLMMAGVAWAGDGLDSTTTSSSTQALSRPMQMFALNCQGCHGSMGSKGQEIPTLANRIGYFARAQEGRAFLVQVPNVALSAINDTDLAAMLNWMLTSYSAEQLPSNFKPYTADEVGALRKVRINPAGKRPEVVKILEDRKLVPSAETMSLNAPGAY